MMRPVVLLAAALALVAGGCAAGDAGQATSGSTSVAAGVAPEPHIRVTATEYAFDMPAEVPGGVVTLSFENRGGLRHEAAVVATGTTPTEAVLADLTPVLEGGARPIPDYLVFYGGVGETAAGAGGSSTFTLPDGDYLLFCSLTDIDSVDALPRPGPPAPVHYNSGMARRFTVRRANVDILPTDLPALVATDYAFDLPVLHPGPRTVLFRNVGSQMHAAAFLEFPAGVDEAEARSAFDALGAPDGGWPAETPDPADAAAAGPFPSRAGGTFTVDLQAGRTYAVVCYLSDRSGGPPHVGRGMLALFTPGDPGE